jgi:hypothetical protein
LTCLLSYHETQEFVASPLSTTGSAAEFGHAEWTTFGVDQRFLEFYDAAFLPTLVDIGKLLNETRNIL